MRKKMVTVGIFVVILMVVVLFFSLLVLFENKDEEELLSYLNEKLAYDELSELEVDIKENQSDELTLWIGFEYKNHLHYFDVQDSDYEVQTYQLIAKIKNCCTNYINLHKNSRLIKISEIQIIYSTGGWKLARMEEYEKMNFEQTNNKKFDSLKFFANVNMQSLSFFSDCKSLEINIFENFENDYQFDKFKKLKKLVILSTGEMKNSTVTEKIISQLPSKCQYNIDGQSNMEED